MAKKNRVHITRAKTETATITYDGVNPFKISFVREGAKINMFVTNNTLNASPAGGDGVEIILTKAGLQALIDEAQKFISAKVDDA
jgi:hypothetical protein